jgi:hypothetical protein
MTYLYPVLPTIRPKDLPHDQANHFDPSNPFERNGHAEPEVHRANRHHPSHLVGPPQKMLLSDKTKMPQKPQDARPKAALLTTPPGARQRDHQTAAAVPSTALSAEENPAEHWPEREANHQVHG